MAVTPKKEEKSDSNQKPVLHPRNPGSASRTLEAVNGLTKPSNSSSIAVAKECPTRQIPPFNLVFTGSEIAATGHFPGRAEHALGAYYSSKHKELEDVFTAEKVRV